MSRGDYRVVYPLVAFDGGLNNKYEQNIIADNESPDCLNVVYDDRGGVQTRGGSSKFNSTAVGSYTGDGLFTARFEDGTEKMIAWWNGTAYTAGTNTFVTIGSAQSVWTAGVRVDACMYQDLIFFGNGFSTPYKYNGTEFTRHGITAPNSTAANASGTAGSSGPAGGDVNYKITYVNSYSVESDVSSQTATLTIGSTATVSITCLPVAPISFGVNARKIYRRSAGSSGDYKLVTTVNDNTTTTFLDQVTDANLGAVAPTDQGVPPLWKYSVTHQERVWAVSPTNPSYLYYSELGNPFVFKANNFILISDGDGEVITGLGVHANMTVIFKENSVWLIYQPDTDPTNWIRIKSNSKYGACSHHAQADYEGLKMFLGKRYSKTAGFLTLNGADTQPTATDLLATSVQSDVKSDRIEPDVFMFRNNALSRACGIEYKNKLWFSVPHDASTNNRVYQYDWQRRAESKQDGSWVPHEYPIGFNAFTVYDGALYAQGVANGFVYQLDTTSYSDDGTAIDSYMWTREFHGYDEHLENWKDFRFANFTVETMGAYFMDIVYKADADQGVGTTTQVDLTSGGSLWGTMVWGTDFWGGGTARRKVTLDLGSTSGKRVQFKFSNQNTLNQGFHIYPLGSFTYTARGKR